MSTSVAKPSPKFTVTVDKYLHGVRIDSLLVKHFRGYTPWRFLRMARAGQVTIDGVVCGPTQRVFTGQTVSVTLIEPPDLQMPPEQIDFGIVFEDQWLLIVNKPAGLIVHPTGEIPAGTLVNAVQSYLDKQSSLKGLLRPGIVHRLDMDTSGAIALCKDHLSHRLLSIQFQRERVSKTYLALVEGVVTDDSFTVDLPIGRAAGCHAALMSAQADALEAQPSKTSFEVVERLAKHTLVRARPRSGRMHQIRVHLATVGYPIVGDEFYGPGGVILPRRLPDDNLEPVSELIDRQALHAAVLAFAHPITNDWCEFNAQLPPDFDRAIQAARAT